MSDPSDFYSFRDFLGLNEEGGNQMRSQAMREGNQLRDASQVATDAQRLKSGSTGAQYDAAKGAADKAQISYADFAAGMKDPVLRRSLLEKSYGKGNVSWLDSAVAGGGQDQLDASVSESGRTKDLIAGRAGEQRSRDDAARTAEEADNARRAAALEAQNAAKAQRDITDEDARVDSFARAQQQDYLGNLTPQKYDANGDPRSVAPGGGGIFGFGGYKGDAKNQREFYRQMLAENEARPGARKWIATSSGSSATGSVGRWGDRPVDPAQAKQDTLNVNLAKSRAAQADATRRAAEKLRAAAARGPNSKQNPWY